MILDAQLQFSSAQAVTSAAASTNIIDVSEPRNLGVGKDLYVVVTVNTALTDGGTNAGVDVFLYGDTSTTFTPAGQQLLFTIPKNAAAGSGPYVAKVSPGMASNYRYLELYYSPKTAALTAGAFTATMTTDIAAFTAYAKGYTVA